MGSNVKLNDDLSDVIDRIAYADGISFSLAAQTLVVQGLRLVLGRVDAPNGLKIAIRAFLREHATDKMVVRSR